MATATNITYHIVGPWRTTRPERAYILSIGTPKALEMALWSIRDSIHGNLHQQGWLAATAPCLTEDDHRIILLICVPEEPMDPMQDYVKIDVTKDGVISRKLAYVFILRATPNSSSSNGWRLVDMPEAPLDRECVNRLLSLSIDATGDLLRKGEAEHLWRGWFSQGYSMIRAGSPHSVRD